MATSLDTKLARQIAAALIRFADREEAGFDGDRALHTACVLAEKFTDEADFLALREALQFDNHWDDHGWPELPELDRAERRAMGQARREMFEARWPGVLL